MRETVNAVNRGNVWIVNVEISILHFSIFFHLFILALIMCCLGIAYITTAMLTLP